jgi:hypothetical protein
MDGYGGIRGNPEIIDDAYRAGAQAVAGILEKKPCK